MDPLGTDFSGQVEIDRFVFIDKQLYGLMSIFGNGVISGWTVAAEETLTIGINEGFGNINFIAGRTTFPDTIANIPTNKTIYVYAKTTALTRFAEEVEFTTSENASLADTDFNFLLLAKVITGTTSIESVDNTVRREIGFIELVKAAIRLHKHRGGSANASKIDLASEVKGQLPSFRIADFDAEKITTGTFDLERMPLLDHQDLENVGLLTHPQLDTFVKTLESTNTEIFGEIGTANMLQLILAAKLIYEDTDSAFYTGTQIDENMINEFALIPGITSTDLIDLDNTTAEVNLVDHFIKGIPPATGTSFFVNFDTALAWSAQTLENLLISGNSVVLDFDEDNQITTEIIEGFESSVTADKDLVDDLNLFTEDHVVLVDSATIISEAGANNIPALEGGFFSGEFTHQKTFRVEFTKEFSTAQDWSSFDSFNLSVKCLFPTHGAVYLRFEDSGGEVSSNYVVLAANEITVGDNAFEIRTVDLTAVTFADDIKKFVIFSDDHTNVFSYFVDNINIKRSLLLPEEGTLNIRYATGSPVTFSTLTWQSSESAGTEISVRARSANGTVLLNRSEYTGILTSGNALNLEGTDLEIELTFTPDSTRTISPRLDSIQVLVLTEAEIEGFSINTSAEFSRGTSSNTVISDTGVDLETPIFVDSIYFSLSSAVTQLAQKTNSSGSTFFESSNEPVLTGSIGPISPNQAFRAIELQASGVSAGFFQPRSVKRQNSRSYVIADTYNDRVLEYDDDGTLLAGVGSINYTTVSTSVFPIAASVDIRTGKLYIVWSAKISFQTVNLSKIALQSGTSKVQLIKDFDKILGLTTAELQQRSAEGQIMEVVLSDQNAGLAALLSETGTTIFMDSSTDEKVIPGGINVESEFYTIQATSKGIPCYIGNFAYVDGIFSPTWADKTDDEGFIIGNANIAVKEFDFPEGTAGTATRNTNVSSILEIDKNNNVIFGSNTMEFSPFFPGRVQFLDTNTLLIGGIKPGGTDGALVAGTSLNFRTISGDDSTKTDQKTLLNQLFFGNETNPHKGAVIVFDRKVNTTTFQYISPSGILVSDVDIDSSGSYVIAESSLGRSGRIIKLDTSGNITFSYGEGLFGLINDINVSFDDSVVIST